ncbi:MAG TPA: hypothetical protein DIT50_01590, partial [Rhodocyclaceae bacterium]|nr:hypothetical protein [Rhodocyclaceae bacterium]
MVDPWQIDTHGQPQETVQLPHPFGVPFGQVVVHRNDVHPFAGKRIEIGGKGRDQSLPLTGAHFGDFPLVQRNAADQLDVEMAHPQHALARFTDHCKRFRQQRVERFAVGEALFEFRGFVLQFGIGETGGCFFEGVDPRDDSAVLFDQPVVAAAKDLFQKLRDHATFQGDYASKVKCIMSFQRLPEAFAGESRLRELQRQGLWLWQVQQALSEILPPEWCAQLSVGRFEGGQLTVMTPSALVVAKLKQMTPTLIAELSRRGFAVTAIRWRVRPELVQTLAQRPKAP